MFLRGTCEGRFHARACGRVVVLRVIHHRVCMCCEECVGRQDLRKRGLLLVLDRTGGACRVVNDLPSIGSPVIVLTSFVHPRQADGLVRVAGRVVFYLITSSGPPLLFPSPKLRGNSNHRCLRWVRHALMHFTVNMPLWREHND